MHQTQPETLFLFRYESTSGLWVEKMLDSPVSRALVEAMNAILFQDGILAFIGTRSEFGTYRTKLAERRETDSMRSWISFPEHTLNATLGLCQNSSNPEGKSLAFYGSPRTLMLGYLIDMYQAGLGESVLVKLEQHILDLKPFRFENSFRRQLGLDPDLMIVPNELEDSMSDFVGWREYATNKSGNTQLDGVNPAN